MTQFTAQNVVYELISYFGAFGAGSGTHPSTQTLTLSEEFFSTCSSARNWKPFIVGIIAPDNPIDFIPVLRLKQELKKAEMPPKLPKKTSKGVGGGENKGGTIVPLQNKSITVEEQREGLRQAWTLRNGGVPPPEKLLAMMCAQMWTESGGVRRDGNGQARVKPVFHAPNYNSFGYHDVGIKPPTFEAPWKPGEGDTEGYYEDDRGHRWSASGLVIPSKQGDSPEVAPIAIKRGSQMYFAPESGTSNLKQVGGSKNSGDGARFYKAINGPGKRFLGTDTEGGLPFISSYTAFDSFQDAANEYVNYIYNTFPDVRKAQTPQKFEDAIMNGLVQNGITRKFHDPSPKVRADYVKGITNGVEAYDNKFPSGADGMTGGKSADATDDPAQKMMAYGASFTLDDPLAPVFGRNIAADTTRLQSIQARMDALNFQIAFLRSIPQLILLVNPQEFRRSHENMMDIVKTRVGNVVHTWLEQPIKISASGVSAAQYAVAADMSGGLSNYNRIHSLSYKNLMSLALIYKSNGSVYDVMVATKKGDAGAAGDGTIIIPGSVFIYYDEHVYIGSFDNFSITDDATKPHNLAYSFTFTVRYDIHVDLGAEAQQR